MRFERGFPKGFIVDAAHWRSLLVEVLWPKAHLTCPEKGLQGLPFSQLVGPADRLWLHEAPRQESKGFTADWP